MAVLMYPFFSGSNALNALRSTIEDNNKIILTEKMTKNAKDTYEQFAPLSVRPVGIRKDTKILSNSFYTLSIYGIHLILIFQLQFFINTQSASVIIIPVSQRVEVYYVAMCQRKIFIKIHRIILRRTSSFENYINRFIV